MTQLKAGERRRELRAYSRRDSAGEDKSVFFFTGPPEVRGVGFLQWDHGSNDGEQWLFTPETARTRRIATQDRDQSFMGTAFSYRDLDVVGKILDWTERQAPSRLLRADVLDGRSCQVLELRPDPALAGYGRIVLWLDQEQLVIRKLEFFGPDDQATKVLTFGELRDVGAIPTAHRLEMQNLRDGIRTAVTISDVRYDSALADELFTQRALERGDPAGRAG